MGILDAASEASVRAAFEVVLPDRCTVKRGTSSVDSTGDWSPSDTDIATAVPCRVDKDQNTDREALIAGRVIAEGYYTITLSAVAARWPGGTVDVRANDTLVVTGSGAGTYEPQGGGGPTTDEWVREIKATKVS